MRKNKEITVIHGQRSTEVSELVSRASRSYSLVNSIPNEELYKMNSVSQSAYFSVKQAEVEDRTAEKKLATAIVEHNTELEISEREVRKQKERWWLVRGILLIILTIVIGLILNGIFGWSTPPL